ncbi:MAG: PAS domain S-box protein [Phenylobacterium sp.]|nr:PAS domain S-box protein [Phenylobacterium sp.]
MTGLWTGKSTTAVWKSGPAGGTAGGLILAIVASAAALAAQAFMRPAFTHAVDLLGVLALLACAGFGGAGPTLVATAVLAGGQFWLDAAEPLAERAIHTGLIVIIGVGAAVALRRLGADRQAAEAQAARLRDRQTLLESSLATMPDAVVVIDGQGVIHSFSQAAERLFGWTSADAVGRNISTITSAAQAEGADGLPARVAGADETGAVSSTRDATGLRKDGSEFPVELRVGEARTGDQRFFTVVIRDLTTFAEAENRLAEMRAQLTQVWSLNSMGEMASVLAHELNQPLSAVANYLRAARTLIANLELEDDDLIDAVARAGDQAVRAGEIIRTMRDLATRGGTLQKPESLGAIVREVDFLVSLMARDAGVRVTYDLYKGDDTVMADRIQIQQLVVNLARNAIEAVTKYPARQVSISTRPDADGNILTTVEDSGPGVDASVIERLFQPLASTKPEGMGLGLSISNAIVENHRGRIWAQPSRLGGAAFCFVLARAGEDGDDSGRKDGVRRR